MNGLTNGTKISYLQKIGLSSLRVGTILQFDGSAYRVRNASTGSIVRVLPQQITRIY